MKIPISFKRSRESHRWSTVHVKITKSKSKSKRKRDFMGFFFRVYWIHTSVLWPQRVGRERHETKRWVCLDAGKRSFFSWSRFPRNASLVARWNFCFGKEKEKAEEMSKDLLEKEYNVCTSVCTHVPCEFGLARQLKHWPRTDAYFPAEPEGVRSAGLSLGYPELGWNSITVVPLTEIQTV